MIDKELIGSVLNSLPMDRVFFAPLQAMIQAQVSASKAYVDFLMGICIKDGKAVAVEFTYDEAIVDEQGLYQGQAQRRMRVPLLATVTHPNIAIEEGTIDFELTIDQFTEGKRTTVGNGELETSLGWGPLKVSVKGTLSHALEQTRKTDTRARYQVKTVVRRQAPPEALMRVIDAMTAAATKPITVPDTASQKKAPTGRRKPAPA